MNRTRPLAWLLAVAALAACTTSSATGTAPFTAGGSGMVSPAASNPPPVPVSDPGKVTGSLAGKTCHVRGDVPYQLPDPACTPGSFDPKVTAVVLCAPAYTTGPYRPPASGKSGTTAFKYDQAYPAYGIPAGTPAELDHLINLDLGGSNDAANLWPEVGKIPNPKDTVENTLHNWVCGCPLTAFGYRPSCVLPADAQDRLTSAQQAIAADWITALDVLGIPAPASSVTAGVS